MKNLILTITTILTILITAFLISCAPSEDNSQEPTQSTAPPIVTEDPATDTEKPPPEIIIIEIPKPVPDSTGDGRRGNPPADPTPDTTPDVIIPPVKFAVKINKSLYFYNGTTLDLWKTGTINKAAPRTFSVGNQIFTLDATGGETAVATLDSTPDAIKITNFGTYTCTEYPPALALSLGGRYRVYSEFYKDNVLLSAWMYNQFTCESIGSVGSEIFSTDSMGNIRTIDGVSTTVFYLLDGIFYNHSLNMPVKQYYFNDSAVVYGLNFAHGAENWINYNGNNYSGNGYTWDITSGLIADATPLNEFNTANYFGVWQPAQNRPVLLSVGEYLGKLYWIECNNGDLLEYDPVGNTLIKKWILYPGDGLKNSGQLKRKILKPLISEGILYFTDGGSINRLDLTSGLVSVFYAGVGEVLRYD